MVASVGGGFGLQVTMEYARVFEGRTNSCLAYYSETKDRQVNPCENFEKEAGSQSVHLRCGAKITVTRWDSVCLSCHLC